MRVQGGRVEKTARSAPPEGAMVRKWEQPARRHPLCESAVWNMGSVAGSPGYPLLLRCNGSPAQILSPLQPRGLGCRLFRSARVPCGATLLESTQREEHGAGQMQGLGIIR